MIAAHPGLPVAASNRGILLGGALLASAIVMASEDPRLQIPPGSEQLLSDEIYEQAGGWRQPPMSESEWRAPPAPQKRSRINLGYDSVHEELRARDDARYGTPSSLSIDAKKPNTQLRLQF